MLLRPINPREESAWLVLICNGQDMDVEWFEDEVSAHKHAAKTLTDAANEDWGPTDVFVLKSIASGSSTVV